MWSLYKRALLAKRPEDVVEIASDAMTYYKTRARKLRDSKFRHPCNANHLNIRENAILMEFLANNGEGNFLIGPIIPSTFSFSTIPTTFPKMINYYMISSFIITNFPISTIERLVRNTGLPTPLIKPLITASFSLIQTAGVRAVSAIGSMSLPNIFFTAATNAVITYGAGSFVRRYGGTMPSILKALLLISTTYLTDKITSRFTVHGVWNGCQRVAEDICSRIMGFFTSNEEESFENDSPPQPFICPICYQMIRNPVEVLGFVFCGSCLSEWTNRSGYIHPYTGEQFSSDAISSSILYNYLIQKYSRMTRE